MLALSYLLVDVSALTSAVEGSVIVFMSLGLLLIGALIFFAAPESLVPAEIVSRSLAPSIGNQALILDSILPEEKAIHVPKSILGGESTVSLVLIDEPELSAEEKESPVRDVRSIWSRTRKIWEPAGVSLMRGYEKALQRDFLELDTQQLAALLGKVIVPELQLASGFSLRELPPDRVEAIWVRSTINHTCVGEKGTSHPELCCLCSSVACALAKAAGRSVIIEDSNQTNDSFTVTTVYRILSR